MKAIQKEKSKGKIMKGVVVSDKMDKTVVVAVMRLKEHPKYRKRYKITKKYKAHDEGNEFKVGDEVLIQETRPISKDKRWRVVKLVEQGVLREDVIGKIVEEKEELAESKEAKEE